MSSASASYRFSRAALEAIERRRREEALRQSHQLANEWLARLKALQGRIQDAKHRHRDEGLNVKLDVPAGIPRKADQDEFDHFVAKLQTAWADATSSLESQLAAIRTKRMLAALRGGIEGTVQMAAEALAAHRKKLASRSSGGGAASQAGSPQERIARILGRVSGDVPAEGRAELEALAADALRASTEGRAETLEIELRRRIQAANEEATHVGAEAAEASRLRAELRGFGTPDARAVLAELARVEAREASLTDDLRGQVRAVEEHARAAAESQYASEIAAEALRDLGYEVEESFATLLVDQGSACFQRPEWASYAVRCDLDASNHSIGFDVVQVGSSETPDDGHSFGGEVEESWCSAIPELRDALRARGVELEIQRQSPPGEAPLAVIGAETVRLPRRRRWAPRTREAEL